jgi:Glycoside hydrolase 123, catalytic domain/Glycoside hydrolase 123 N-terminal domain
MIKKACMFSSLLFLLVVLGSLSSLRAGETSSGVEILNNNTRWRCHWTWKTELVIGPDGKLSPPIRKRYIAGKGRVKLPDRTYRSDLPASEWKSPDFNDSNWARTPGPVFTRGTRDLALICLRGKFMVKNPGALKNKPLNLSLIYRGGIVVYVNGKELSRGHLPAGKIDLETPAKAYPDQAYVTKKGSRLRWVGYGEPQKYKDRFAMRNRKIELSIPASALRKGINVLGLEIHRAPTNPIQFTAKIKSAVTYSEWDMVGFESATLRASQVGLVEANTARPAGLQVWNCPLLSSVHTIDFADPNEKLTPIEIAGTRNGVFSGKIVVSSDSNIKGLKVSVTTLKNKAGDSLPEAAVQLRYGILSRNGQDMVAKFTGRAKIPYENKGVFRFDALSQQAPSEVALQTISSRRSSSVMTAGAVQPVWITVRIPADAKPGDYSGRLTVGASGAKSVSVPVGLTIANWSLPNSKNFKSFVGMLQSPESLAMRLKVPMWSPKHWKLIEESFKLMGELGAKDVYIIARAETYHGNEHSMIRWIKQADGSWKHDFSIVEKYLDIALKHLGQVPVVGVMIWDVDAGSTYMGYDIKHKYGAKSHIADKGTPFSVLDPKTGKLSIERSPKWSDPKAVEFWKPVYDGLRKILAKRGIEKSISASMCPDKRPGKQVVEVLKAASGGAPWLSHAHPMTTSIQGEKVLYSTTVWAAGSVPDPSEARYYGWKAAKIQAVHPRLRTGPTGEGMRTFSALGVYHLAMERSITSSANLRGVGRLGADFWPVFARGRSKGKHPTQIITGRYDRNWHGGYIRYSCPGILGLGKDGPVPSARFEAFREGIQEAEARIFIEQALLNPADKAKLGAELSGKCQQLLDERVRVGRIAFGSNRGGEYLHLKWYEFSGVQKRAAGLYALAAEVAKKKSK